MTFLLQQIRQNLTYIAIVILIGTLLTFTFTGRFDYVFKLWAVAGIIVVLDFALFNKHLLMLGILATIPLSVKIGVAGGASASVPAELLTALIAGIFLYRVLAKPTISKTILRHPITIILFIDIAWLIVSSSFSTMPDVSFKRVAIRALFVLVFYFLLNHWFQNIRNIPKLFYCYMLGLIVVIGFTIKAHAHWDFITQVSFNVCEPFYSDHTIYGAAIAFIIPFALVFTRNYKVFGLSTSHRNWMVIFTIILLVAEFLSYSRASWLSIVAVLALYWLIKMKISFKMLVGLIAVCIGGFFFFMGDLYQYAKENDEYISNKGTVADQVQSVTNMSNDASNLERINRWVCAVRMFKEKPLLGYGPGTYQFQYGQFQSAGEITYISTYHGDKGNAHSEFLTYLSETGIFGMINFILLVLTTIWLGLKLIYKSASPIVRNLALATLLGISTFFVHGLFNSFIDQDKMAVLVFGSLAILVALDVFHSKKETFS
jgi:putative inorganic carbon (HCO3(-)) transporter